MYEVFFYPEALEFLGKLDKTLARRIWNKIRDFLICSGKARTTYIVCETLK